jgi:hypothetical protein
LLKFIESRNSSLPQSTWTTRTVTSRSRGSSGSGRSAAIVPRAAAQPPEAPGTVMESFCVALPSRSGKCRDPVASPGVCHQHCPTQSIAEVRGDAVNSSVNIFSFLCVGCQQGLPLSGAWAGQALSQEMLCFTDTVTGFESPSVVVSFSATLCTQHCTWSLLWHSLSLPTPSLSC